MCFTPAISLTTAVLELAFAIGVLYYFRKSVISKHVFFLLLLLGAYQFSEFGLCTGQESYMWAMFAFLSFAFLPAVGLHIVYTYLKKKKNLWLIYAPPVAAIITSLIVHPFILKAECGRYFVSIWTYFMNGIPGVLFGSYYFGFILASLILLFRALRKSSGKKSYVLKMLIAGILLMGIPTFIVLIIFPATRTQFSSVLCQFAFLTAIALMLAVSKDSK